MPALEHISFASLRPAPLPPPAIILSAARESNPLRVSVIIPALNEAENLRYVLPHIPSWVHEVVLVDGDSTDGTVAMARSLCPNLRVIIQPGRGKGDALRTGFSVATGDIIVTLNADGSTDPRELPTFIGALLAGADFVKGSRFLQGGGTEAMSTHRRLGNWGFSIATRLLFGGQYSDLCYGYSAFFASVLPQLVLDDNSVAIMTQMNVRALRAGLKISEVPSVQTSRIHGKRTQHALRDGWRVLTTLLSERFRVSPQ